MFDIGFFEILLIVIIGLLVIGPQRMPEVARTLGSWYGKINGFITNVKQNAEVQEVIDDINQSINLEETKQEITSLKDNLQTDFDKLTDYQTEYGVENLQEPFASSKDNEKISNKSVRERKKITKQTSTTPKINKSSQPKKARSKKI